MNDLSNNLLDFIKKSPSAFHAVEEIKKILIKEGFIPLNEGKPFELVKGKNYFVTRNQSSIIAFKVGSRLEDYSFSICASHSDCPSFKVKPKSELEGKGYTRIDVEPYGGMIASSWFDRPLSLAGRVIINLDTGIDTRLINFPYNLLSIPNVAIHMNREINSGYKYNFAIDMMPTLSQDKITLKNLIAKELNVEEEQILTYDLFLYNRSEGYIWGANEEFISSPKLDDLQSAYTSLLGFIQGENEDNINVYACFDNEEVGSTTRQGADSSFLEDTLKRISLSLGYNEEEHIASLNRSFAVSADNAHALHPNHPELCDPLNQVEMNKGIVIKNNAAQSYTTDSYSAAIFMKICAKADVPVQFFNNRYDLRGGGTLGNISCSHASIATIDIGLPQLAMHSCMESAGTKDNEYMVKAIKEFYSTKIKQDTLGKVEM